MAKLLKFDSKIDRWVFVGFVHRMKAQKYASKGYLVIYI